MINLLFIIVIMCQVNVVKGLRLYQDIFSESELPSLVGYINDLRMAGHKGELSGKFLIFTLLVFGIN